MRSSMSCAKKDRIRKAHFLRHAPCMRHVKKDYEVCAVSYQSTMAKIGQTVASSSTSRPPTQPTPNAAMSLSMNDMQQEQQQNQQSHHRQQRNYTKSAEDAEEERLKTVCCAFHKYMQCSEFTVRHACGDETALFTRKFLDKMSNTLMRMHCVDYTPESGKCRDYFSSHATRVRMTTFTLLFNILVVFLVAMAGRVLNSSRLI
ncbi:uncharacterized protein LOC131689993 isoform X2 [Topomyia yanbarensis]|uniref:uncharacterized protein LOC131689993 isoform X2 n=1 Tax=Topomyia yanbarensis TaxID=2498891 RepID=UPI00273B4FCF|nr:uncharacterized protein LOC131689993 isoform X2 [Topomyia yanbarensis]